MTIRFNIVFCFRADLFQNCKSSSHNMANGASGLCIKCTSMHFRLNIWYAYLAGAFCDEQS